MKAVSPGKLNHILSLLDAGQSTHRISSITGVNQSTVSRISCKHRSHLPKSSGGRPSKLTPADICYAQHLITSRKAENAVQVTKTLTGHQEPSSISSNSSSVIEGSRDEVCSEEEKANSFQAP